jgi:hypothetical protein
MTEQQILCLKPAPRLERVRDEHSERVQDRNHRSQGCDDSALRCESRLDGIFGKDKVAVLGGCGELVSTAKFPDHRENTGKFPGSNREGEWTALFSDYTSATYTQIPYASEQGILLG